MAGYRERQRDVEAFVAEAPTRIRDGLADPLPVGLPADRVAVVGGAANLIALGPAKVGLTIVVHIGELDRPRLFQRDTGAVRELGREQARTIGGERGGRRAQGGKRGPRNEGNAGERSGCKKKVTRGWRSLLHAPGQP